MREVLVVYGKDVLLFVADGICGVQLADTHLYLHMFPFYVFVDAYFISRVVNRETLQESKIIKIIKKKLVRKVVEMIRKLAIDSEKKGKGDEDEAETKEAEIDADGNVIEVDDEDDDEPNKYIQWYKKFAPSLKMGVIEDDANRGKLSKLLRFHSSKTDGEDDFVSFEQYVGQMKEWQDEIYFFAGQSEEEMEASHFMDKFNEKGVEVLYFTDPIDEYMVQNLRDCKFAASLNLFWAPPPMFLILKFYTLANITFILPPNFLHPSLAHQSTERNSRPSPRKASNSRTKMRTSSSAEKSTTRSNSSLSRSG